MHPSSVLPQKLQEYTPCNSYCELPKWYLYLPRFSYPISSALAKKYHNLVVLLFASQHEKF